MLGRVARVCALTWLVLRSVRHEGIGFLRTWQRVRRAVPGWLLIEDARHLYAAAHHGPGKGAIVEIGSAWGKSTALLAAGSQAAHREPVWAIDPHTGDPEFLAGMIDSGSGAAVDRAGFSSSLDGFHDTIKRTGVGSHVIDVVMTSDEAADTLPRQPIRLLYVDGLHDYESVSRDIRNWVPRVVPGGIVVFDDYHHDHLGVRRAVGELLRSGSVEPRLHRTGGLHVWVRARSARIAPTRTARTPAPSRP